MLQYARHRCAAELLSCSQTFGTVERRRCSHDPIRLARVCGSFELTAPSHTRIPHQASRISWGCLTAPYERPTFPQLRADSRNVPATQGRFLQLPRRNYRRIQMFDCMRLHDAWRRCAAGMLSCAHAPNLSRGAQTSPPAILHQVRREHALGVLNQMRFNPRDTPS